MITPVPITYIYYIYLVFISYLYILWIHHTYPITCNLVINAPFNWDYQFCLVRSPLKSALFTLSFTSALEWFHPSSVRMISSPNWSSICSPESILFVFCIFEQGPWQCNNFSRHQTKYIGAIASSQLLKSMFLQTLPQNFFSKRDLWDLQQLMFNWVCFKSFGFQKSNNTWAHLSLWTSCCCKDETSPLFTG